MSKLIFTNGIFVITWLKWSYRYKNNGFEQLITSANDYYQFLKDLGKSIFRSNIVFFVMTPHKNLQSMAKIIISIFEHI